MPDAPQTSRSTTAARFAGSCARCRGPVYEGLTHHCGTAVTEPYVVPEEPMDYTPMLSRAKVHEIAGWIERDLREPDKILCHLQSLRRLAR